MLPLVIAVSPANAPPSIRGHK